MGQVRLLQARDLGLEVREPEPDTQELEARVLPLLVPGIAAALTGVAAGAPLVPLLQRPKREPEPETQELEARILPLIGAGLAGLSGLSGLFRGRDLELEVRETEPETQELEARILPLVLPGLAAAAAVAPLIPGFPKPKRELSEDLFSREPQALDEVYYQDLNARVIPALLPAITNGLSGLSAITPLIPSFVNRPKREPSPEPQSCEQLPGIRLYNREPSPEPQHCISEPGIYLYNREPSPEPQFWPFPPDYPPFRTPRPSVKLP